ncbi:VWA domain-containing protein, partial [Streptomyces sp. NPDC005012]|uniref:VWA domain-containing protein n=1 Tax=Streptomyces sp. NPDC005012 TaxID=3154558 RepID=UPI0033B57693
DAEAKAQDKPKADADADADAEDEPKADAEAEDEPKANAEPEDKPKANAEPEAAAEADAAPEADAQDKPDAEPEADAEAKDEPEADAEADADAGDGAPAIPTPLAPAYAAATAALEARGLADTRARVYLVLDRSASMRPYYKDGSAQALGEQALALAALLAPEGPEKATLPVVFFSTEIDGTGELTLSAFENKVDDLHADLGRMGRTSYHAAVAEVLRLHDASGDAKAPALVVFQTDGAPDAKTPATQAFTEAAASHPGVFFSLVAFGEHDNKAFDYARKLKTGNTAFFHAGPTPLELTDRELYDGVLADWQPGSRKG